MRIHYITTSEDARAASICNDQQPDITHVTVLAVGGFHTMVLRVLPRFSPFAFSPGWNFISFPEQPTNTGIEPVLAYLSANVRIVWGYDNRNKQWLKWTASTLYPLPSALRPPLP